VFGSDPRCDVVLLAVGEVVSRRDGALGVICDEVVVVDPAAITPVGMASETPTEAMAAANLNDFTGLENVVERAISHRADELLRILHGFRRGSSRRYRAGANESSDF
jgi:hypothetical protein